MEKQQTASTALKCET